MEKKDIYLIPTRGGGGKVNWTWAYDGNYGTVQSFPVIDLGKDSGEHKITFTIIDPQSQIVFDGTSLQGPGGPYQNAFWVMKKQGGASKQPGVQPNDQLSDIAIGKGGVQLTLKDKNNGDAQTFAYQLNFKDMATGNAVTAIDPDLKNGGGGGTKSYSAVEVLVVVLVVALATAFLTRWALNLSRASQP